MRTWIICVGALIALSYSSVSSACEGRDCGCSRRPHMKLFSNCGVRHCGNCDDAPVVVGGPGIPCGGDCGSCSQGCGSKCGSGCRGGGLLCTVFGWIGQCGKCSGCGPKYIPEWHSRPCEPCDRCGNWTGPSLHRGKAYLGPPRSGSNMGSSTYMGKSVPEPAKPLEAVPTKPLPDKATMLPQHSVKRTSYAAPSARPRQMPRHRRAAPQATRTIRMHSSPTRMSPTSTSPTRTTAQPFHGVIVE